MKSTPVDILLTWPPFRGQADVSRGGQREEALLHLGRQTQATDEILYTLVPDSLLLHYITDEDLRARVKRIIREGRRFDLLLNPTEKNLRRNLIVWLQKQNHRRKFARYYPEPTETSY